MLCLCVCVCVFVHARVRVRVRAHVYVCAPVCVWACECVYLGMDTRIYVHGASAVVAVHVFCIDSCQCNWEWFCGPAHLYLCLCIYGPMLVWISPCLCDGMSMWMWTSYVAQSVYLWTYACVDLSMFVNVFGIVHLNVIVLLLPLYENKSSQICSL